MAKAALLRKAGEAIGLGGRLKAAISGSSKLDPKVMDYVMTFAPDIVFGGMAAAQTPGDGIDKLIAGGAQAIGGGLGGVGLTALTGNTGKYRFFTDMAGGYGGDIAGMFIGDNLMRGKDALSGGKGQTPYEKMGEQQQEQYAQALRQQILTEYGLVPGTREQYAVDPTTGMGVY